MNKFVEFSNTVLHLLSKGFELDKIKKNKMFNNIQENWWDGFGNIKLRINQKYVLEDINKNGIRTGIHCQATGCGKSYIILMYCDYFKKFDMKGNIIIFTERVSILDDFFDLKQGKISEEKKIKWKNNNIIDLNNFKIIDRVTKKNKDWHTILQKSSSETKILLINRAFLTLGDNYKGLNDEHVGLIIHDECHNTPSDLCYNMLLHFKNFNIPTVGFSATPLRAGKTSNEFNKDRLITIYGNDKKTELTILSNFNMIYAVEHKLILPPKFVWYEMPKFPVDKDGNLDEKKELNKQHVTTVFSVLNDVIPNLPHKKIIAWCGTIEFAKKWYKIFSDNHNNPNIPINEFKDFTFYIDHSQIKKGMTENNYDNFKISEGNSIIFCANKHREGSDIPKLDCCIFIDFVKNRSPVPFIQSIGRVLRIDGETKLQGYVIDSFVPDSESYEKELVEKIIGYYMSFENLNESDFETSKYDNYLKIKNKTKIDADKQQISFKLGGNNIINIDCKNLQWKDIVNKFEPMLQNKIKLSACDNLKSKASILKNTFGFNANSDFINEYRNISNKDKIKFNLPNIDDEEYLKIFNTNTWFDILDIKHDFIDINELIEQLKNKNIDEDLWYKLCIKNEYLPLYPHYVYKNFTFKLFNNDTQLTEM